MMQIGDWLLVLIGLALIAFIFTPWAKEVSPTRGVLLGGGVFIILIPIANVTSFTFLGNSFQRQIEKSETVATNAQFNALSARVSALEIALKANAANNKTTLPTVTSAIDQARRKYVQVATHAANIRTSKLRSLAPQQEEFDYLTPCCKITPGTEPLQPDGGDTDSDGPPCCGIDNVTAAEMRRVPKP